MNHHTENHEPEIIHTAIIDDDEEFVFSLQEHLGFFPEISIRGSATRWNTAQQLLKKEPLDLVFLDVEMPVRSGFDLLEEARRSRKNMFSVVFYSAYDRYIIQGLREAAFDYILKPIKVKELKGVIERFKEKRKKELPVEISAVASAPNEIISLPTPVGLRFMDKNNIIFLQCTRDSHHEKPGWKAVLTNMSEVKLRTSTTAREILDLMGGQRFIQINQSAILNLNYLGSIEFKTRDCHLIPPFNGVHLMASRNHLYDLRNRYDIL